MLHGGYRIRGATELCKAPYANKDLWNKGCQSGAVASALTSQQQRTGFDAFA